MTEPWQPSGHPHLLTNVNICHGVGSAVSSHTDPAAQGSVSAADGKC